MPTKIGQEGLTTKEAQKRLIEYGENRLTGKKKIGALKIFFGQFKDLMVIILLISTVLSTLMGEITEAIAIIVIVLLNAILGFVQEFKTEKTLEALKNISAPTATVMRDGQAVIIPAAGIVPDDVVLLKSGDKAPADGFVLENISLCADEALLTGESLPVQKVKAANTNAAHKPGRDDMVYMGTTIAKGRGKMLAVSTGMDTEMGKIAVMLDDIEEEQTPLQKRLDQLGKYIAVSCLAICIIVSVTGILRGENVFDMIITGISLAVAAVPEGLPAIVTIALALAVNRILKRNALVRNLHAVETLGCANVICSDKTGTLTENKMTVKEVYTVSHKIKVTGTGYEKSGEFLKDNKPFDIAASQSLTLLFDIAKNCNNGELANERAGLLGSRNTWKVRGEATETALLIMCQKAKTIDGIQWKRLLENPFDSNRKLMSVVLEAGDKKRMYAKGASDVLIEKCTYYMSDGGTKKLTPTIKEQIKSYNNYMAQNALRVLGFAYKDCTDKTMTEDNFVFVGMAGMIDPPRKEAYDAVLKCRRAKIRPVMITGDHKLTACAIAKDLNILTPGDMVMTGSELDMLSDAGFDEVVSKIAVFARVTPAHKLRIVRALKKRGDIVAMTGDGVNDAPAIKEANIGVAMGISGTDVTKEASSIILLDDNFATLIKAVEEGRVIYKNIRKFIRYLLSCNIGEVVTMFAGMLMGMPVVLLPIQILLINLVTDGLPAMALGMEGAEKDIMSEKPRASDESIFSGGLFFTIVFRGLLIGLTTLSVFVIFYRLYGTVETARTGALLTLIMTQLFHVFECKSEKKSLFTINIFNNWRLIFAALISGGISMLAIYSPAMRVIFSTTILNKEQLIIIFGASLLVPVLSAIVLAFGKNDSLQNEIRLKTLRIK